MSDTAKQLRVLVIGPGNLAVQKVIPAILEADMELVGLVGRSASLPAGKLDGIKYMPIPSGSYDDIPDDFFTGVDFAVVLTPSGIRRGPVEAAARNGAHVLVTKPMALTGREAHELVSICEQHNVQFGTMQPQRHTFDAWWVGQAIRDARFGKIISAQITGNLWRSQSYYDTPWHRTWELDNGVLGNQAQHEMDLLCCWFGAPQRVISGYVRVVGHQHISVPDFAGGVVEFSDDITAIIHGNTCTKFDHKPTEIRITGTLGYVVLSDNKVCDFRVNTLLEANDYELFFNMHGRKASAGHSGDPMAISVDEFVRPLQEFADFVRWPDDEEFACAGLAGLDAVNLVEGIHVAAQTGEPVDLTRPIDVKLEPLPMLE